MVSRFHGKCSHKLSIRLSGNISSLRASSCTEEKITIFFIKLQKQFFETNKNKNTSCYLWSFDEIGFSSNQGKQHIICRHGAKRPLKLIGNNEKN